MLKEAGRKLFSPDSNRVDGSKSPVRKIRHGACAEKSARKTFFSEDVLCLREVGKRDGMEGSDF